MLSELENPVVQGSSGKIDINLLAMEQISEEELIRELVKPATPGYYKDVMVEIYESPELDGEVQQRIPHIGTHL